MFIKGETNTMKNSKHYKQVHTQVQQTESQAWALDIFSCMELTFELRKTFQQIQAFTPVICSDIVHIKYLFIVLFYSFLQLTMLLSQVFFDASLEQLLKYFKYQTSVLYKWKPSTKPLYGQLLITFD